MIYKEEFEYYNGMTFYEWKSVKKSRTGKVCCICGEYIPVGTSSQSMHFYEDNWEAHNVCNKCMEEQKDLIAKITSNN